VTFAESVLHLVRAGARIDSWSDPHAADSPADPPAAAATAAATDAFAGAMASPDATVVSSAALEEAGRLEAEMAAQADGALHEYEPGLADLEAAVGLVSAGLATRVILSGFPSWPGLLWRAYQLADTSDVLILPTVVRPGGKVDIVITRDTAANG
jgi:hypothetical protein